MLNKKKVAAIVSACYALMHEKNKSHIDSIKSNLWKSQMSPEFLSNWKARRRWTRPGGWQNL